MYKKIFKEEDIPEVVFDKKVTSILKNLRDSNFKNEESRKQFADMITSLMTSKDKRARQTFKRLGQFFTDAGDELLKYGKE